MKRQQWASFILPVVGLLVLALALVWTVAHQVPSTVHSRAELSDVAFGWPVPWYHQDLSRTNPAEYPIDLFIVGDRVDPVTSTVDLLPLAFDVILAALAIWLVWAVVFVPLIRRAVARRAVARRARADQPVAGRP